MAAKTLSIEPLIGPETIAERLQQLSWWDWDHNTLHAAPPDFRTLEIEAFLEKYEAVARASSAISRQSAAS